MSESRIKEAVALMNRFAERTGLSSDQSPKRYLWTDAFAVCNYLGLTRTSGGQGCLELALALIDAVHHTLGRHRDDDPRTGWISGLDEQDGERHPTLGGLRIGKDLPERAPQQPYDDRLEWDRDGQYFHYLTKWMHALDQVARATRQARFNVWARELAQTAFNAFTLPPSPERGPRRMVWKMSIDLTRVLVPSMGQHDPLDGYITHLQLRSTAAVLPSTAAAPDLEEPTRQFAAMIRRGEWATADPLGLGGLLIDAYRVQQLMQQGAAPDLPLLETLLDAATAGLKHYTQSGELQLPAKHRLAFRELGLAIGLRTVQNLQHASEDKTTGSLTSPQLRAQLKALNRYRPLREDIEDFWREPEHQHADSWTEHRNINEVMLATSLMPEGLVVLLPPV